MFHHSLQFYNFWHFRVSAQPLSGEGKITSSFWKILFAKSLIFFLLNLHWNIYDIKNTEQLKQSLNTDWNVLTSSQENIKIILTDTDWLKMFRELPNFFSKFVEYKFCFWKTAKFFSKWSNYEKFISQRKVWYIFQYKKF